MSEFTIDRPTAYPYESPPGPVLLTFQVVPEITGVYTFRVAVYEGSWLPGRGDWINSIDTPVYFVAGQPKEVQVIYSSTEREQTRRDVRVNIISRFFQEADQVVHDQEWDDVFYVRMPGVQVKVLRFAILGEEAGGEINFNPQALDAEGHYEEGTVVYLTAIVNPGFVFVTWRGEVDNPLSTSLYNTVTMSENRLVKAEFALAEVEKLWPLEVDITPSQGGYVTTSPSPVDIDNHFTDGTVGKFIEDTRVQVAAHPNAGYEFVKWSDEIQGGVSYNPTEWVSGVMDERKTVKAHFREVEIPPECAIDADCPTGYVCQEGVCIPEEVPPEEEPSPEEPSVEFPWLPVALLAGGAIILVTAIKPKKK